MTARALLVTLTILAREKKTKKNMGIEQLFFGVIGALTAFATLELADVNSLRQIVEDFDNDC